MTDETPRPAASGPPAEPDVAPPLPPAPPAPPALPVDAHGAGTEHPAYPAYPGFPGFPAEPAPPVAPRSRRGLALGLAAALVAVVAGGGVGYAVLHDKDGGTDAKPAAAPWTSPTPTATKAFGAKSGGSHYGSLRLMLLPIPTGYSPGPDVDQYGNDVTLDAEQARALVLGDEKGMSAKERKTVGAAVDDLHIEGAGMRTYTEAAGELVVQIRIVQMKNKEAARAQTDYFSAFTKAMGVFRTGPKVKGYPKATCVLPPAEPGDKLDTMTCQATEGDLMVTMTVEGTRPLDKTTAAGLLSRQLDRIKDPGEAV
ncbi:hypothetical protein SAMN05216223_119129 [Actinacidiphila yanglinensis]|uniref:Uncharacterized protein n=1 Tax=Actinacidiphila yanglinensis TaxID=310779 RepID=A0A1H6DVG3_9ACTN|nr:hypothetical protein [Actinacidiphila yanglinensis]SEG88733.1 hypothetical protein SAMN05216223_119129 [Actinacidiphila yanglinensis]